MHHSPLYRSKTAKVFLPRLKLGWPHADTSLVSGIARHTLRRRARTASSGAAARATSALRRGQPLLLDAQDVGGGLLDGLGGHVDDRPVGVAAEDLLGE